MYLRIRVVGRIELRPSVVAVPLIPYYLAAIQPVFTDDAKAAAPKAPWPPGAVKD